MLPRTEQETTGLVQQCSASGRHQGLFMKGAGKWLGAGNRVRQIQRKGQEEKGNTQDLGTGQGWVTGQCTYPIKI